MDELLRLLADYYGFIWGESRYRIVDSGATESFGNALVVLASDRLCVRVARDRGQFHWDFQAPDAGSQSIDGASGQFGVSFSELRCRGFLHFNPILDCGVRRLEIVLESAHGPE